MATPCPVLTFTVGTLMVIVFSVSVGGRRNTLLKVLR